MELFMGTMVDLHCTFRAILRKFELLIVTLSPGTNISLTTNGKSTVFPSEVCITHHVVVEFREEV
jgi:hypothetical protein